MGMTIDRAIPKLQFVRNALNDGMEIAKAYDLAIETMRKYQKIEQAYSAYLETMNPDTLADLISTII